MLVLGSRWSLERRRLSLRSEEKEMMAKGLVFDVLVLDFADIATAKERLEWPTYIGCPLSVVL